ncbi:MAG: hypothetical protein RL450_624 [Actinomycetota bacterium]|jgi:hypothetical protein
MQAIQMKLTFEFASQSNPETIFDSVAEALFDLEAASDSLFDADVVGSLSKSTIVLSIVGSGETIEAASANASSAIRSAIHKSGGATTGWDETVEVARAQSVFKFLEQKLVPTQDLSTL